jgi:hypothetical protein
VIAHGYVVDRQQSIRAGYPHRLPVEHHLALPGAVCTVAPTPRKNI